MNDNGQDNRRSFRISERVYLKYEIISDREFQEGLDQRKLRAGMSDGIRSTILDLEARFEEKLYVLRTENGRLAECMSILNEKLNAVIEQLPDLRQSKASLARSTPITCEIGADGMAFASEKHMDEGTKLAMRFLLESDNRYIETFARVVRGIDPPGDFDSARPFGIAVEFDGMKPAQKEILIQHLFNRESESLRIRRLELDAADLMD